MSAAKVSKAAHVGAASAGRRGRGEPALPDVPDIRDRMYEPTLLALPAARRLAIKPVILDQGPDGACTGFAVAGAINLLLATNKRLSPSLQRRRVSPHMLYTMARRHDEWPGDKYSGSSLRGAMRGFYNCGACSAAAWPSGRADVSPRTVRDARLTQLGAYYRLRPVLSDYHAAINETGCIVVSALVHSGWDRPVKGRINPGKGTSGHAFLIVGYDDKGFRIQNSWGDKWAEGGIAHWPYQDWMQNVMDAWVLQLAVPAPAYYGIGVSRSDTSPLATTSRRRQPPERSAIAGHFVHVENGGFQSKGKYWSTLEDVRTTANLAADSGKYAHFAFYAHGGLNDTGAAAVRTKAMLDGFRANGIYPYSVFYDTGLVETMLDVIQQQAKKLLGVTGGRGDWWDGRMEMLAGPIGTKLWTEMKRDARLPFEPEGAGDAALRTFLDAWQASKKPPKVHLIGHSTGGILVGYLLAALERICTKPFTIASVSLLAPACSVAFYESHFRPRVIDVPQAKVSLGHLDVYNLDDDREADDDVAGIYRKSLLYLVSNAFEEQPSLPLLGMQRFAGKLAESRLTIFDTKDHPQNTRSRTHGGFDEDPVTMNSVLTRILGHAPSRPFTKPELRYEQLP